MEFALSEMREEWQLPKRMRLKEFVDFLVDETEFVEIILKFPYLIKYAHQLWWGAPTIYEAVASLHTKGFLSHRTALYLHDLTSQAGQEPDTVYFNIEQSATGAGKSRIQQQNLNAAFQRPCRVSNNTAEIHNKTICLLSGQNTGNAGVEERRWSRLGTLRVSSIERALIEGAVRPVYSGGTSEVLQAYGRAADKISPQDLAALLKKLNYAYPYNQAIGFYMERSGAYQEDDIALFHHPNMTHDFYLDYEMANRSYSSKWRLYYPSELDR